MSKIILGSTWFRHRRGKRRTSQGTALTFTPVQNALPVIMTDTDGTKWDAFGKAVDGPRKGEQLRVVNSYIAYWFAWAAFWQNTELWP